MLSASCSKWTEPESLEIHKPSLGEGDSAAYEAYLSNLRSWKGASHQVVLASFDNTTLEPVSRAHHIASLPDSLDYVLPVMLRLPRWQHDEMKAAQQRKGTRFLCTLDCAAIAGEWDAESSLSFGEYAASRVAEVFDLCGEYGYDGVLVCYSGMSTMHMTEEELAAYTARQNAVLGPVRERLNGGWSGDFLFCGNPKWVLERSMLLKARYIVVDTDSASSADRLTYEVLSCVVSDVPSSRFVVTVSTAETGVNDPAGWYGSEMALPLAAEWVTRPSPEFGRAGLLIRDVQRDFYNAGIIYKNVREAVATINPSPKN